MIEVFMPKPTVRLEGGPHHGEQWDWIEGLGPLWLRPASLFKVDDDQVSIYEYDPERPGVMVYRPSRTAP
jgi:hypothetical protein